MEVKFKFNLHQKVKTAFGDSGIVDMLGVDGNGNTYYVKTANNTSWFTEEELEPLE